MNRMLPVGLLLVTVCGGAIAARVWGPWGTRRDVPRQEVRARPAPDLVAPRVAEVPLAVAPDRPTASEPRGQQALAPAAARGERPQPAATTGERPQPVAAPSQAEQPRRVTTPAPQEAARPRPAEPAPMPPLELKPIARFALSFVGADPLAEQVWAAAINDPTLSAHDRQDLIEDLNEDGFADPKDLTDEDLPLIVSRLQLIEQMAPDAMDDVNAAAFEEAYKDLVNMFIKVTRL